MQTRKVRKAVIPAAGHGTRFMPITKSVPKEMLVLVDKPAIHYIVEECAESGIEEVAIIVSRGKEAIERYFTPALNDTPELKALLKKIKITFITQETLNGTGGAILLTKDFVGDEPFAVLFGDDVVVNDVPCIKQLIDANDETGKNRCRRAGSRKTNLRCCTAQSKRARRTDALPSLRTLSKNPTLTIFRQIS
ncbi:MAG: NTP transferase domain-containing protein [Clostridiales bacterium]|nr:MAG: NTP transferase domain-containing protein [Clostridiales bacterium]